MPVRGIRGATVSADNTPEAILTATRELIEEIAIKNPTLVPEDISSIIFTVTDDLTTTYPAKAARELGWTSTPLMCAVEIPVPGSLSKCIRALLHWNTALPQSSIRHIYLKEAASLRPDLTN